MNRNKIIIAGVIIILIAIVAYALEGESPEAYKERILKKREEQESFMRNSEESPFVEHQLPFDSLNFFPPDKKYKINARLEPIEFPEVRSLSTSDGYTEDYLEYGYATFTIDKKDQKLLILENTKDEILFLAFGDETSANETYGAGRYLEVKHNSGNTILLDFNLAYNPYCAYTDGYSCPLPPAENLLTIAIKAGEKNYHSDKKEDSKEEKN